MKKERNRDNETERQGTRNDLNIPPNSGASDIKIRNRDNETERQGTRSDLNIVQKSAPSEFGKTRDTMAKLAGVSHDTYDKGRKILDSDNEEVKQKVLSGDMSINAGYNVIKPN